MTTEEKLQITMHNIHSYAEKLRQYIPDQQVAHLFIGAGLAILLEVFGKEQAAVHLMHLAEAVEREGGETAVDE